MDDVFQKKRLPVTQSDDLEEGFQTVGQLEIKRYDPTSILQKLVEFISRPYYNTDHVPERSERFVSG